MRYPHVQTIARERTRTVYGAQSHLAASIGISRQTLHARMKDACRSRRSHGWIEFVLCLQPGTLAAGEISVAELQKRPDPSEIAYALANADRAWNNRKWKRETE